MVTHPHLVDPPDPLWRVARVGREVEYSEIDALNATLPKTGNRFDVPGGGVLYCSSRRRGCYVEVLARHRPSPRMAAIAKLDPTFMAPGAIPAAWRSERRMAEITLDNPLPFVDVEHEATRAWLQQEMAVTLAERDVEDLDVAAIRGNDRLLTRAVAQHIYVANDDGSPLYSGIRYLSRHGDYECWAIFDGNAIRMPSTSRISRTDPDLEAVARTWGLSIHGI
jgi:hypothetical protein